MSELKFTVPGGAKPHPRPRACIRGKHAGIYPVKAAEDRKYNIQQYAVAAMDGDPPYEGPVSLELVFVLPRPASMNWKTKPTPRIYHTKLGECDNFAKGVMDAFNGVIYLDDRQVWHLDVTKWVAAGGEAPHTFVKVEFL